MENLPIHDHKIYQIAIKYYKYVAVTYTKIAKNTNIFHSKTLKNIARLGFLI
jgi:hypothetical protein